MTIQEAYNKGLDDAENAVINVLRNILLEGQIIEFANPKLAGICEVVKLRSDYYLGLSKRNNNVGKTFRKLVAQQVETIDNPVQ